MPEPASQAATIATLVAFLLSLIALFAAFQRHVQGKPILKYEPRKRVPWGPLAIILPLFLILLAIMQWIATAVGQWTGTLDQSSSPFNQSEFVFYGYLNSAIMIGFAICILAWLSIFLDANAHDLGLPQRTRQLGLDILFGCWGCLVAMLPVYIIHYVLYFVLQPQQQHQLIEVLQQQRESPQMFLVGLLMVVFAAPIFEEVVFRLLLQGWLERNEDELIGFQASEREPPLPENLSELQYEEQPHQGPVFSYTDLPLNGSATAPHDTNNIIVDQEIPRRGTLFGLPHGWQPILISSTAFGIAHIGHGVSAVPLIFFGVVLGYLYQRTHRLAPSIAAHMLFNAYTMGMLWLG